VASPPVGVVQIDAHGTVVDVDVAADVRVRLAGEAVG